MKIILHYDENTEVEVDWPVVPNVDDTVVFENSTGASCVTQITEIQHDMIDKLVICVTLPWQLIN